jgi:uncharacterized protein (UPF0335 family)
MSKPMATTKAAGPVSAERLKSFIERIEKLEEERKAIGGDVKDVYSEAKGVGYDVATMRKIVALRAKDAADVAEQDTLLDVYKHALGMETNGTVTVQGPEVSEEELEALAGRIVMEVDRCMALVSPHGKPPMIEDIKALIGCSTGKAHKLRGLVQSRISQQIDKTRENENAAAEKAAWLKFRQEDDADTGIGIPDAAPKVDEAPTTPSVGAVGPQARVAPSSDDEALDAMLSAGAKWKTARASA